MYCYCVTRRGNNNIKALKSFIAPLNDNTALNRTHKMHGNNPWFLQFNILLSQREKVTRENFGKMCT